MYTLKASSCGTKFRLRDLLQDALRRQRPSAAHCLRSRRGVGFSSWAQAKARQGSGVRGMVPERACWPPTAQPAPTNRVQPTILVSGPLTGAPAPGASGAPARRASTPPSSCGSSCRGCSQRFCGCGGCASGQPAGRRQGGACVTPSRGRGCADESPRRPGGRRMRRPGGGRRAPTWFVARLKRTMA